MIESFCQLVGRQWVGRVLMSALKLGGPAVRSRSQFVSSLHAEQLAEQTQEKITETAGSMFRLSMAVEYHGHAR
jgi:hypothetical protein